MPPWDCCPSLPAIKNTFINPFKLIPFLFSDTFTESKRAKMCPKSNICLSCFILGFHLQLPNCGRRVNTFQSSFKLGTISSSKQTSWISFIEWRTQTPQSFSDCMKGPVTTEQQFCQKAKGQRSEVKGTQINFIVHKLSDC